ncbi:MAG TPA: heat-inducible transcriptional repressor HrcA [Polyangiaceae bacterium]|nr:heat-inducible transcriptional repressor HrcA [Polyangiaceae bacterium]
MGDLQYRARSILYAAITEFISTGEPVGSRTLAKRYGLELSPASIRNVLSDLEEDGYLHQPHTSAGRIPTDRAFRLFIDTLMQIRPLSDDERGHIAERFHRLSPGVDWTRASGRVLSELTGTAVVIAPKRETRALTQLRFIPTRPGEMLAVVVLADGTVENRFIRIERPLGEPELTRVHNLLADVIEGRSLGEVRELFARRLQDDRVQIDSLRHRAFELGHQAIGDASEREGLVIEGEGLLLDHPEFSDVDKMRQLIHGLGEREVIVSLLDRTIESQEVQIFVGSETGDLVGGHLSVVAAPYTDHGRVAGTIGVLGPTRMDYPKVVPLVEATADAMSASLKRGREGDG